MAIIVFSKPVAFPIAPLRELLEKHLPLYRWQVGEEDRGGPKQMGSFADNSVIAGRSGSTVVMTRFKPQIAIVPEAPVEHEWHVRVDRPTTDDQATADRALLIICMTMMMLDETMAHCQLSPGGNWLTGADLLRVFKLVLQGESIDLAAGLGRPSRAAAASGDEPHSRALQPTDPSVTMPGSELTALVVLADRHLPVDRASLLRMARDIDPDGGWRVEEHRGQAVLVGRGTLVGVLDMGVPLPDSCFSGAWTRSHWFAGDRRAVEGHVRHITVKSTLDTRRADYETVRQVAKIITLAACWIARQPGALAIVNLDVGTIFEAAMGRTFLGHLGRDELAVALWTWTKPESLVDGDVSLSTSGLLPFVGHELETWNAPLDCAVMAERFGDLIRYLLTSGPVIGDGDSAGTTADDQSIRCFLGPSRAARPAPVQALVLEVETPTVAAPRPDLPDVDRDRPAPTASPFDAYRAPAVPSAASPAIASLLGNRIADGGNGAGLLPTPPKAAPAPVDDDRESPTLTAIVAMTRLGRYPVAVLEDMLGENFPDFRWDVDRDAPENRDRIIIGRRGGLRVTARFQARAETLPLAIPAPPHQYHLRLIVDARGDRALARAVALVVCCCLIISIDGDAHFQLSADRNWLSHDDAMSGVMAPKFGRDIADFDRVFGKLPATFAGPRPDFPGAHPPATDGFEIGYLGIAATGGNRFVKAGERASVATEAPATPPTPRRFGFGRKGL